MQETSLFLFVFILVCLCCDFRESEKMKRSGIANLLTPASKQEIYNGKEYGEEESIGYI